MIDIKIDPEFEALIPRPTPEELDELEKSLEHEGCRDNLVLWNDTLLDGHNRFSICTKHGIKFGTSQADVKDRQQAMLWIISNQLGRRNLTPFARTELVLKRKNILAGPAEEMKLAGKGKDGSGGRGRKKNLEQNSAQGLGTKRKAQTRDSIAKAANVSHDTVSRVEKLIELAPAPTIEKLRKGEVTIHDAYKNLPRKPARRATQKQDFENIDDFAAEVGRQIRLIFADDGPNHKLMKDLNAVLRNAEHLGESRHDLVAALELLGERIETLKQRFLESGVENLVKEITGSDEEEAREVLEGEVV